MGATSGHPTTQPYSRAGLLAKLTGAATLAVGAFLIGQGTSQLASTGSALTYSGGVFQVVGSVPGTPGSDQVLIGGGAIKAGNGIFATGGQIQSTATLAAGAYSLQVLGAASAARDIALFGQFGFSNGFTVKYTGSSMAYSMLDGNLTVGGDVIGRFVRAGAGGALHVDGAAGGVAANRGVIDMGDQFRMLACGPNTGTRGTIKLIVGSSDASLYSTIATIDSIGMAVTGAVTASGDLSGRGVVLSAPSATTGDYRALGRTAASAIILRSYSSNEGGNGNLILATADNVGVYDFLTIQGASAPYGIFAGGVPGTPGGGEVRIGGGAIKAGSGITGLSLNIDGAGGNNVLTMLSSGAHSSIINMSAGGAGSIAIQVNGTTAISIAQSQACTFMQKVAVNGATASSTLTGNTVAQVISWLQTVFA